MLYVQAGVGIVADSVPDNEWTETQNKARGGDGARGAGRGVASVAANGKDKPSGFAVKYLASMQTGDHYGTSTAYTRHR